jgi:acyl-CoA synthetase (AMP-forming)/AMP-acid ligase II/NAD(P)-dependent dehydrogenase (short-subunit alcohol dehydrogenase family)
MNPESQWPEPSLWQRVLSRLINPGGAPSRERLAEVVAGKTVLVTGASYGIGRACALLLGRAGAKVLLVARSAAALQEVARELEGAEVWPVDLMDLDAVARLGQQLAERHDIDIVINNAGKSIRRSLALSYDRFHDVERTMGVNYLGPVRLLLALLPGMVRRRRGHIVNVSTIGVRIPPGPRWGAYQASKGAFDTWFRSVASELQLEGVATTSLYMALVYTRMSAPTPSLRGVPGLTPEQAAGLVARALVHEPAQIAPWWLGPAQLLSVLLRRPLAWLLPALVRRTQDNARETLGRALRQAGLLTPNPWTLCRVLSALARHGARPSGLAATAARRFPDHPAVIDDQGTLTYGELDRRVQSLSRTLQERYGIGPGSAVGIMCRNHRGFVEALLAVSSASADAVLLNTEFPGPQLAQVLRDHPLACVLHDPEFAATFAQAGQPVPRIYTGEGAGSTEELIRSHPGRARVSRHRGKIVILTSGTTGAPKGAARSPRFSALKGPLVTLLCRVPLRARTTLLVAPPLFHGFGLAYLALSLLLGATLVLRRRFDPETLLADVSRHQVRVVVAVPTMLRRLLELPEDIRAQYELSSLQAVLSAGSPLGASLGARFMATFGPLLYNLYGSSETGFGSMATPPELQRAPGTVGRSPQGTALRILGPDDQELPAGQIGRIFVRSGLMFGGYVGGGHKDIVDGFMSTGDLGHVDEQGLFFVDGRADDMIVSGGENVFPLEVEEQLASHPDIAEVAVIGVPDEEFGQRLEAFVVCRGEGDADALRAYLKERIARYKVPRDFVFLPQLPRTPTGKLLKRELQGMRAASQPSKSGLPAAATSSGSGM